METPDDQGNHASPQVSGPWRDNEESRRPQLREDAARPPAVNLAEGLAPSEFPSTFTGRPRER